MADKSKAEDMTPVPTQAQLDEHAGGKDRRAEPRKVPEAVEPYPSQEENDKIKAGVFGVKVEKRETKAKDAKDAQDLTPTPTQAEHDAIKLASMYVPPENPEEKKNGGGQTQRRQVEAKPAGGYQTRATEAAPAKAE